MGFFLSSELEQPISSVLCPKEAHFSLVPAVCDICMLSGSLVSGSVLRSLDENSRIPSLVLRIEDNNSLQTNHTSVSSTKLQ